eukprot:1180939-Prorocentrum_minimum.AAC.2
MTESIFSAGATVARGLSTSTTEVIGHRYGGEAKAAAEKGFGTVGNMGRAAYELSGLGVKGLAKKTAKLTVTNVVLDRKHDASGSVPQIEGADGADAVAQIGHKDVCNGTPMPIGGEEEYPQVPVYWEHAGKDAHTFVRELDTIGTQTFRAQSYNKLIRLGTKGLANASRASILIRTT